MAGTARSHSARSICQARRRRANPGRAVVAERRPRAGQPAAAPEGQGRRRRRGRRSSCRASATADTLPGGGAGLHRGPRQAEQPRLARHRAKCSAWTIRRTAANPRCCRTVWPDAGRPSRSPTSTPLPSTPWSTRRGATAFPAHASQQRRLRSAGPRDGRRARQADGLGGAAPAHRGQSVASACTGQRSPPARDRVLTKPR